MFEQWQQLSDDTQTVNPDPLPVMPEMPAITAIYDMPIIRTGQMPARGSVARGSGFRYLPRNQRIPVKTFYYGGQQQKPKKFNAPVVNLDQTGQAAAGQPAPVQASAPQAATAKPESTGWFASLGISPWMLLLAAGGGLLLVYFMGMTSGKKK